MSNKRFECPRCYKRCGNAGALKTHMKTHEKPEPKSGSMLKWVVKRVKSEIKPKPKMAIELKPIVKTRQLKLRKPTIREPTVVPNPVRPRPPRRPRKSKQPPVDTSPFTAPARLTNPDLDRKSPQFRIAHVQHFKSLKSDFPVLDRSMYHEVNKACLGVSLRRFQQWFEQYDSDLRKVSKPKPKKERYQNKVLCQGARNRFTPQQKFEAHQTKPKTSNAHPKEIIAARNAKQPSAKKAAPGINRTTRPTSWRASVKAIEAEALLRPFSKIIRDGTNCILL